MVNSPRPSPLYLHAASDQVMEMGMAWKKVIARNLIRSDIELILLSTVEVSEQYVMHT